MTLIENAAVRLRTWQDRDATWYGDLIADPTVMRFIGDGKARSRNAAEREIAGFQTEQELRGWSRWVAETSDGRPFGFVGFGLRNGDVDWGGRVFRAFWGSRCILHSVILAVELGIFELAIPKAIAHTQERNRSAWRLNESIGFTRVGSVSRGPFAEIVQTIERKHLIEMGQRKRNRALSARLLGVKEPSAAAA